MPRRSPSPTVSRLRAQLGHESPKQIPTRLGSPSCVSASPRRWPLRIRSILADAEPMSDGLRLRIADILRPVLATLPSTQDGAVIRVRPRHRSGARTAETGDRRTMRVDTTSPVPFATGLSKRRDPAPSTSTLSRSMR